MPKYRKFWLKTTESLDLNEMPDDFTRLLWVMLPLGLDADGKGLDNTSWIKAKVMPLREDVTPELIEAAMEWFASRQMIYRYQVDERNYFLITSWNKYQGDTSREAPSNFPDPIIGNSGATQELLKSNSSHNDIDIESTCESILLKTFVNASGIPDFGLDAAEVAEKMDKAGVIPEDIEEAVKVAHRKKFILKGLSSVQTMAINIAKQRLSKNDKSSSVYYEG